MKRKKAEKMLFFKKKKEEKPKETAKEPPEPKEPPKKKDTPKKTEQAKKDDTPKKRDDKKQPAKKDEKATAKKSDKKAKGEAMDIFQGTDGEGVFLASVCSPDHYYMNCVPFTGGEVNGELTSYNRRWEDGGTADYTVTGTLENGTPAGPVRYAYSDGGSRENEGEGFTSWPDWPEELSR